MNKPFPLEKINSTVRVDLNRLRDSIPENLFALLMNNPFGKILDHRMTDGKGLGYILELSDGSIYWFFREEIEGDLEESNGYTETANIEEIMSSGLSKGDSGLYFVLNPFKFFKWLFYSLKDVF